MLSDIYTPVGIYLRVRDRFRDTVLLESTDYHAAENSYSFICIQAIGGVNEKIEGFFDVCRIKGLTGTQGIMMPESNVEDLMLREDILDAVAAKRLGRDDPAIGVPDRGGDGPQSLFEFLNRQSERPVLSRGVGSLQDLRSRILERDVHHRGSDVLDGFT